MLIREMFGGPRYQISWLIFGFMTVSFPGFAFDMEDVLLDRGQIARAEG